MPYTNVMYRPKRAFTLIELIVVIAIIAILSILVILSLYRIRANAKLSQLSDELSTIAKSVNLYADDNNYHFPQQPASLRGVPLGLEKYLVGGSWPVGPWKNGEFEWDTWPYTYHGTTTAVGVPAQYQPYLNQNVLQISYHLCPLNSASPATDCIDPVLFPTFTQDSGIFYCIDGPCIPHQDKPEIPGYCVNCKIKPVNY